MRDNSNNLGIGITAYNRPYQLSKTLEGLKLNKIKKIHIFCDGAKKSDVKNLEKISEVRKIAEKIDWCEKEIFYRDKNLGLKKNTFLSMDYMFENYNKVIFLDDDCLSNENFISFLSNCLEKYKDYNQIKSITGYCPKISIPQNFKYDIFFSYRHCPWGFASWKRCWLEYKNKIFDHYEIFSSNKNKSLLNNLGNDLLPMVINDYFGLSDSIGITWAWYVASSNGININPKYSLVKNIGHDGSGRHSSKFEKFNIEFHSNFNPKFFPEEIKIDIHMNKLLNDFHKVSLLTYCTYSYLPIKILKMVIRIYFYLKKILKK